MKPFVLALIEFILRPVVWFLIKYRTVGIYLHAGLGRNERVLDIGSGHNPWFRSNVLLEKFPEDDTERGASLHRDGRKLVIGDTEALPFADKSFDFIYCSHVAEHIENLTAFFREIQRVGKAGYIETPNYLFEQTVGTTTHLWAMWVEHGVLHAERKWMAGAPERAYHGMHRIITTHPLLGFAHHLIPELQPMQFWWRDRFDFVIHEAPKPQAATRSQN